MNKSIANRQQLKKYFETISLNMKNFPIFLSVVFPVRNLESRLEAILKKATSHVSEYVSDYELIIIDNASVDLIHDTQR